MLVIRLQRTGRKNMPTYRIVLSEKTKHARKGMQEILGHYLPKGEKTHFECDQTRAAYWIKLGAVPSDTVARLLSKAGMKDLEKYVTRYTKRKSKSAPAEEAPAVAASASSAVTPVA